MANELNIKRAQELLQFVGVTNEILKRFQGERQKQASVKQAVEEKLPALLSAMVDNERIAEHQKDAVANAVKDPVQCMELAISLAKHRNSSELQAVGTPVGQAKAASSAKKRPIGNRVTNWDDTEAGQEFRRALMGV